MLSSAALVLGVLITCLLIVRAVSLSNHTRVSLQGSYEQQLSVNLVAIAGNRFSEQVAELTLLGPEQSPSVDSAGRTLSRALETHLERVEQKARHGSTGDVVLLEEREEQSRITQLQQIVADTLSVAWRIEQLLMEQRQPIASSIYYEEIETALDEEMDRLIDELQFIERQAINEALMRSDDLSRRALWLVMSVIAIVVLMTAANALLINRTITSPLAKLSAATDAISRGELAHEVDLPVQDEFGELGCRFNLMVKQLAAERERVHQAQCVLENQVAERTDDLARANAQLREIDTNRANFLADISHELRTPLTVLRGQAEVALRDQERKPDELRQALQRIVIKSDQIAHLVNDLMLLSSSENGSIGVEIRLVKLQDVIADVLLDSEQLSRRGRISISAWQPETPVFVNGDEQRLRQAILIALDNAIAHAPERSTVEIELTSTADTARVVIRDQGQGFRETELTGAFERFYRGSVSRDRSVRGLGLGLPIAKWIADQHRGAIEIANAADRGAVIRIILPLASTTAQDSTAGPAATDKAAEP